ncbi:major facilitator superfamily domain-containing protein [Xylaria bambusicola]|uniref:major facilitator superfamily domain-containing protein n=1 Tax=Xylaria bambusicola TaxID=326684 RepID=UPI002007FAB4|nr:major facilitator superfamily domain-containing protein [Xylaria bambusicola]KAI0516960.1 major facilitator superfamily domain-containing protein [Xylaria bambusicola]
MIIKHNATMNEKFSAASEVHSDHDTITSCTSGDLNAIHEVSAENGTDSLEKGIFTGDRRSSISRASGDLRRTASNVLAQVASRITTKSWAEPPPPPDGGLKAWTQAGMGFFVLFSTWGYANSFGAFQTYYTQTLPEPPSTISWIGGIQVLLSLVTGLVSGRLLDAGFFMPVFFVGIVVQLLGIFLMSISTKFWQLFLTQGVISGLGAGIYFTPAVSLVSTYFDKRRGLAVGIATAGNSLGGAVYPLIVRELIPKVGFAWTTRVIGFLNLGLLSLAFAFMRPRLPPRKSGPILELGAFKEIKFTGFLCSAFFVFWANYYTFYYIASFGTQALNLPYSSASLLVVIINGVGLPFRIIVPMLADRIGNLNVIVPVALIWAIVSFTWLAVHSISGYYAFTVVYGITSASFQCLFPSTVARITPRLDTIGTRLGMAFSVSGLASLTGPPIGGAIQAASGGGYLAPQIWAATVTFIAFVLFTAVRIHIGGLSLKARC